MNHSTIAVLLDLFILITIPVLASTSTSPTAGLIGPGDRRVLVASHDKRDSGEFERKWEEQVRNDEAALLDEMEHRQEFAAAQNRIQKLEKTVQNKTEEVSEATGRALDAESKLQAERLQNAARSIQGIMDRTAEAARRKEEHRKALEAERRRANRLVKEAKREAFRRVGKAIDLEAERARRSSSAGPKNSLQSRDAIADLAHQKMPGLSVHLLEYDPIRNDPIDTTFRGFLAEQSNGKTLLLAVGSQLSLGVEDGIWGGNLDLLEYSGTVEYGPEHVHGLEQQASLKLSELVPLYEDPRIVVVHESGSSLRWKGGLKLAGRRFFATLPKGHPEELILVGVNSSAVVKYRRHQDSSFADMYLCVWLADDDMYEDPREGDILMTKNGMLVGVMVSEQMAFVLPESIDERPEPRISLGTDVSLKSVAEQIDSYQKAVSAECSQIPDCD